MAGMTPNNNNIKQMHGWNDTKQKKGTKQKDGTENMNNNKHSIAFITRKQE